MDDFSRNTISDDTINIVAGCCLVVIVIALIRVLLLCNEDSRRGREYRRSWNDWQREKKKVIAMCDFHSL